MTEILYTCTVCGRSNFTKRGLRVHTCKPSLTMPKTQLKPSSVEHLQPGQPSSKLVDLLKQAGAQLSDAQLAERFIATEQARGSFCRAAIELGILLLAKKATLKHGQYQKWAACLKAHVEQQAEKGNAFPFSDLNTVIRSVRNYTFLSQHFLADLEQGSFQPETGQQSAAVKLPEVSADEVLALETLPEQRRDLVRSRIEAFVAGRSLRRMLSDFRRAENAAEAEEAQEQKASKSKPEAGEESAKDEQMELFKEITVGLTTIHNIVSDDAIYARTNRAFWKALENSLASELDAVRSRLRNMAGN
ncbi:MAG: hypothetical protein WC378_05280 [Opitutaceae bacterium]|jgi:hypothetical protein